MGKKIYKLWIEIEEYDEETDTYRDLSDTGEAEPVDCGEFETVADAQERAESIGDIHR